MSNRISISTRSIHVLRVLTSGIFLVAGAQHLFFPEKTAKRIEQANFTDITHYFGDPQWLVILSGIIMLATGLLFMIGYKTKWMAIILFAVLIPITLTVQVGQLASLGPLFKNIAISGGLLFFILNDTTNLKIN